jgi:hypothetical protein
MVYILRFFPSSKCSLFHNSIVFGSCIIRILHTGCAKTKKKLSRVQKVKFARKIKFQYATARYRTTQREGSPNYGALRQRYFVIWATRGPPKSTVFHCGDQSCLRLWVATPWRLVSAYQHFGLEHWQHTLPRIYKKYVSPRSWQPHTSLQHVTQDITVRFFIIALTSIIGAVNNLSLDITVFINFVASVCRLDIDRRAILYWILRKSCERLWNELYGKE